MGSILETVTPEVQLALCCARTELSGTDRSTLEALLQSDLSWRRVLELAAWHRIYTFLYWNLRSTESRGPEHDDAMRKLKDAYLASAAMHLRRQGELRQALTALRVEGIPVIVLKGAALAETVYPDPAMRVMEDVDILVEEQHLERADGVIRSFGYETAETPYEEEIVREGHRHYPRLEGKSRLTSFEVHRHLVTQDTRFHFDISACWQSARRAVIAGVETMIPAPDEMLLHLCVGFFLDRRRFHQSFAALRQLVDISETIRHYGPELDWDRFVRLTRQRRMEGPAFCALASAKELLGVEVPEGPLVDVRPEGFDDSMNRLFIARKVLESTPWFLHELVTVADNTRGNMTKSALRRMFFPGGYLRIKYWPHVERPMRLYIRHGLDALRFAAESAREPGRPAEHLRVDRWMHFLEAPHGEDRGPARGQQ